MDIENWFSYWGLEVIRRGEENFLYVEGIEKMSLDRWYFRELDRDGYFLVG